MPHGPMVTGDKAWMWNGDRETPTLAPSILVRGVNGDGVCHSFLRDGRLEFLGDCTHPFAGKAVDLPDWPYDEGAFGGVDADGPSTRDRR